MTAPSFNFVPPLQGVIAHRGASAYAPENTCVAMREARRLGACWVEFDVVLTADEVPVVLHDTSVNRTTNGHGDIAHLQSQRVMQLDAGSWFDPRFATERVPLFEDMLNLLSTEGLSANIEVKPYPGTEKRTAEVVLQTVLASGLDLNSRLLFSSFSAPSLATLHALDANLPLGMLMHRWQSHWLTRALEWRVVSVHVNQAVLTPERCAVIKAAGYHLLSYTVNTRERAHALFDMGVDAVFSDHPDLMELK